MAVFIDKNLCRGCGICIDICPVEALTLDIIPIVDAEKCTGCGECITACPFGAIAVQSGVSVNNSSWRIESAGAFTGHGFVRGKGQGRGRGMGRGMGVIKDRTSQDSLDELRFQAGTLKQQLEEIQNRINRLKSSSE